MNFESFRAYCLSKNGVSEEQPFGPDNLVYKVMGKMFSLAGMEAEAGSCNLKCDPAYAEELREKYPAITPGYHMSKKHWNTVVWDSSLKDEFITHLIDHSYDLVVAGLPLKDLKKLLAYTEKGKRKTR